jgi:hypothetical protein
MISEDFQYLLKRLGPTKDKESVEKTYADSYRGRLPPSLIDFWVDHGWGNYAGGMLKICDPAEFFSVIQLILKNDKDFKSQECLVFAFTVFGRLFAWHPEHREFSIDLLDYTLSASSYIRPEEKTNEDIEIASYLITFNQERNDLCDASDKPMYARAVKELGYPTLDECFGFFPALILGGQKDVQHLKRVKAREHFAILAELRGVELMDFGSLPPKFVREIG